MFFIFSKYSSSGTNRKFNKSLNKSINLCPQKLSLKGFKTFQTLLKNSPHLAKKVFKKKSSLKGFKTLQMLPKKSPHLAKKFLKIKLALLGFNLSPKSLNQLPTFVLKSFKF